MTTYIHLSPGPEPKRLTASVTVSDLKSHLEAFLNKNNPKGFLSPEQEVKCISGLMESISVFMSHESFTLSHVEMVSETVHEILKSPEYNLNIHPKRIQKTLVKLIGFRDIKEIVRRYGLVFTDGSVDKNSPFPKKQVQRKDLQIHQILAESKEVSPVFSDLLVRVQSFDVSKLIPSFIPNTLEGELIRFCWLDSTTKDEFSQYAKRIKALSQNELKHSEILNVLSVAFGYKNFPNMKHQHLSEGSISYPNLRKLVL